MELIRKNADQRNLRIIKSLYCSGESEYTDYENAVNNMNSIVLSKPISQQKEYFYEFIEKMNKGLFPKSGNSSIFSSDSSVFIKLFQAYFIYETNPNNWIKLINFFFNFKKIKCFSDQLISILNLINIDDKKVFLYILKKINKLEINGNLNKDPNYAKFLKLYLEVFYYLGYTRIINEGITEIEENSVLDVPFFTRHLFPELTEELTRMYNNSPVTRIKNEIQILLVFLNKNTALMECKKEYHNNKNKTESKSEFVDPILDMCKQYKKQNLSDEEIITDLTKKYKKNKLTPYEIDAIWNNLHNQKI